jgi:predicted  nucleic acid-binding Zn-ribbon protein
MTWTELLAGASAALALILLFDRVVQRLLVGQYVKREELAQAEKTLKTEQILQGSNVKEANHRIDLLAKVIEGLPGYPQFNDLKEDVTGIKQESAVTGEKLKNISDDVHEIRKTLDRMSSQLRER